jgi:hypothetical protein
MMVLPLALAAGRKAYDGAPLASAAGSQAFDGAPLVLAAGSQAYDGGAPGRQKKRGIQ